MNDLFNELMSLDRQLQASINQLSSNGKKKAEAEAEYRVAIAERILKLRDEKVPVTIINDLARGERSISMLRLKRDIADVTFQSNLEHINAVKLRMKILNEQLSREWGRND